MFYAPLGSLGLDKMDPKKEIISSVLSYDPVLGGLFWNVKPSTKIAKGQRAGTPHCRGYVSIKYSGFGVSPRLAHRLVWILLNGEIPAGVMIDHINGDRTDNRIENLRLVDGFQNMRNQKRNAANTSGFPGVSWKPDRKKWRARVKLNRVDTHLGYFSEYEDACQAAAIARLKNGFSARHVIGVAA